MTNLRALVGACFLLAVIGTVVSVPLGPGPVFAAAEEAISSTSIRPLPSNSRRCLVLATPTQEDHQGASVCTEGELVQK